jgi:hypothetical protein
MFYYCPCPFPQAYYNLQSTMNLENDPAPPGTGNPGSINSSGSARNSVSGPSARGTPILSAAAILGPTYGRILNKKAAAIVSSSKSLTSSKVLAPIFGMFRTTNDHRVISTYRREFLGQNQSITMSFNPATRKCSCTEATPILQRRDKPAIITSRRRVLVQSDHCFSLALPVTDHTNGDSLS